MVSFLPADHVQHCQAQEFIQHHPANFCTGFGPADKKKRNHLQGSAPYLVLHRLSQVVTQQSLPVGALTATLLPAKLPTAVPAAKPAAMRQSTLPNLACCTSPAHEGGTMANRELPSTLACKMNNLSVTKLSIYCNTKRVLQNIGLAAVSMHLMPGRCAKLLDAANVQRE